MYLRYFGLAETPFAITPDPAFVYLSQRHRDALAHLLYGIGQGGSGGFVQLTGEVGTGKTTLCRCLLEQVPEGTRIALVLNPLMTPTELLAAICEELGLGTRDIGPSNKALVDRLNHYLLRAHEAGERVVVVIDEAQNLSPEALEQVRLLTNLETSKKKLLQIVLLGQPELRELLQRRNLRQLAQRITARYHLTPLGPRDSALYVQHRMQVAGADRNPFRRSALKALFQRSHGVPRLINIIADRALVGAYAEERRDIDGRLIHAAADEVQLGEPGARRSRWPWVAATAAGLALAAVTWYLLPQTAVRDPAPATPMAEAASPVEPPVEQAQEADFDEVRLPPAPDLDEPWLDMQHLASWQGLASVWNDYEGGTALEAACRGRPRQGYACLRDTGSWARIRQLGMPVILELHGSAPRLLLLQGIDDTSLLVGAPGTSMTVSRAAIEDRWLGGYYVAWPQAPSWPREVALWATGPAVETILDLAAQVDPPYTGQRAFGREFEAWLILFQARNGLDADGIVGPKTLLYLIRSSISDPVLVSDWPRES
jgi:general secretion pathway protein A